MIENQPLDEKDLSLCETPLKPCPFCGSRAFLSGRKTAVGWQYRVSCMRLGCWANVFYNSASSDDAAQNAFTIWQNRFDKSRMQ